MEVEADSSNSVTILNSTEDNSSALQTTRAVLTLEMLKFQSSVNEDDDEDDEEDYVSEAEETPPEPCRPRSDMSQNTGWLWPSQDQNNNPRPISEVKYTLYTNTILKRCNSNFL